MQTLSKGFKRPETNDPGSLWFPAMEDNITQLNSHDHDGTDSALIPSSAIDKTSFTTTVTGASLTNDGGGNYSKVVTVPAAISGAINFADIIYYNIVCKINTAGTTYGDIVMPTIERESATTFTMRVNDNTIDYILYYT